MPDPSPAAGVPQATPPASPYATLPEAVAYTRLSTRTITRAVKAGKLLARHVGSRVLFVYEDLDRFIRGEAGGKADRIDV